MRIFRVGDIVRRAKGYASRARRSSVEHGVIIRRSNGTTLSSYGRYYIRWDSHKTNAKPNDLRLVRRES